MMTDRELARAIVDLPQKLHWEETRDAIAALLQRERGKDRATIYRLRREVRKLKADFPLGTMK
jgi:hypothetical protein